MNLNSNDIILFSGDSITDGNRGHKMDCNHIMGHGYQYIVSARLALENSVSAPKFINKGYSGFSMPQIFEKWQEDVINNKPTVVSILAGVNDIFQGCNAGKSASEIVTKYSDSLTKAIKMTNEALPDTKIIVCEPFYFPLDRSDTSYRFTPHPECEAEFIRPDTNDTNEMCEARLNIIHLIRKSAKELAEDKADVFVALYDGFANEISKSKAEYFIWDGTHPTIAGHALIAEEWLKAFNKI